MTHNRILLLTIVMISMTTFPFHILGLGIFKPISMEWKPTDISATLMPRTDSAGINCALIKMVLLLPNISLEGDIIGDVEFKQGEYWVYLPRESKKLSVRHDNYTTTEINFPSLGIDFLVSNCTYELIVEAESNDPEEKKRILKYQQQIKDLQNSIDNIIETGDHKYLRALENKDINLMLSLAEDGYEKAYLQLAYLYEENSCDREAEKWAKKAIYVAGDTLFAKFLLVKLSSKKEKKLD